MQAVSRSCRGKLEDTDDFGSFATYLGRADEKYLHMKGNSEYYKPINNLLQI